MYQHHQTGKTGEDRATQYLIDHDYSVVERNWATRWGEIDIIAQKAETIYFFEVKTRQTAKYGHPFEAVTRAKRRKIVFLAKAYVASHPHVPYRALALGVIGILGQDIFIVPSVEM